MFYSIREDKEVMRILNATYDEIFAALKHRSPEAQQLIEDDELSQLHDLLPLLRLGHLKVDWAEDDKGRLMMLEIRGE